MIVSAVSDLISGVTKRVSGIFGRENQGNQEESRSGSGENEGEITVPEGKDIEIPEGESMTSSGVNLAGELSVGGTMYAGSGDDDRVKASGEPIANVSDVEELKNNVKSWKKRAAMLSVILFLLGWILPPPWDILDLLISLF